MATIDTAELFQAITLPTRVKSVTELATKVNSIELSDNVMEALAKVVKFQMMGLNRDGIGAIIDTLSLDIIFAEIGKVSNAQVSTAVD